MIDSTYVFFGVAIMAAVTYLVRMIPLVFFRREIQNRFIRSFLAYVPYAVLAAMTFPGVLFSTGGLPSGLVGLAVAVTLAFFRRGLLTVAVGAAAAVFLIEQILRWTVG